MALRAVKEKVPLALQGPLWQQLWSRAPVSPVQLDELMQQAECPRSARLVALRSMALKNPLSPSMINHLVHLHMHHGDPHGAVRLVGSTELPIEGTEALLRALVETNRNAKAWEVFENMRTQDLVRPTPHMIVSMLRSCFQEKNPDAADRLVAAYESTPEIELAHIAALTTRQRTLRRALEQYNRYLGQNAADVEAERRLMAACERCGHTERAKLLWRKVRSRNSEVDTETLASYIRTFKTADIPQEEKEKAVRYLWSLVLEVGVSPQLLNAMICVFGSAGLLKNVMQTWESFASFKLAPDAGTYEALLEATTTSHQCFMKVWEALSASEFDPTPKMCDLALETLVRFDDMNNVLAVLEHMHIKQVPLRRDLSKEGARHAAIERLLRSFG